MSEIARDDDIRVADDHITTHRPHLAVVPEPAATKPASDAGDLEPNAGRSGVIGYAIGFTVACIGITIAGTLGGIGFGASLGLGAFVGFWGGGGFGFMLGATIPLARYFDAHPIRPAQQGENP